MTADREALSGEIARVLPDALGRIGIWDVTDAESAEVADALADLLAARDRQVRAEALREAAEAVYREMNTETIRRELATPNLRDTVPEYRVDQWLRDRADLIEADS